MEPFPSINKVCAFVSKEEKQQSITSIGRSQSIEVAAFVVKSLSNQTRESNEEQPRGKFRCSYCNKPGHTKDKCFKLVGFPPGWQSKAKASKEKTESASSNNVVSCSSQSMGKGFILT